MTNWMEKIVVAFAATGTVLGLALTPLEAQNSSSTANGKKPNVVFILADNVGYGDLGPYGGGELRGYPTPRIDQLAREGLRAPSVANLARLPRARFGPSASSAGPGTSRRTPPPMQCSQRWISCRPSRQF